MTQSLGCAVPELLRRAPSLPSLLLASNNISGNLPDMRGLPNLQMIDVGGNSLAPAYQMIDVGGTSLGPVFPRLRAKVATVVLSRNKFTAACPATS